MVVARTLQVLASDRLFDQIVDQEALAGDLPRDMNLKLCESVLCGLAGHIPSGVVDGWRVTHPELHECAERFHHDREVPVELLDGPPDAVQALEEHPLERSVVEVLPERGLDDTALSDAGGRAVLFEPVEKLVRQVRMNVATAHA